MAVWFDIDRDTRINGGLTVKSASSFLNNLRIEGVLSLGSILNVESAIGGKLEMAPSSGSATFTGDLIVTGTLSASSIEGVDLAQYYTKAEVDTKLSTKSNTTHNHDPVYLKLTGGTLSNSLTIKRASHHLYLHETGTEKIWSVQVDESNFSVLENGLVPRLTLLFGGGAEIDGDITAGKYNSAEISGGTWTTQKSTWLGQDLRQTASPLFNGLHVNTSTDTKKLIVSRQGNTNEALSIGITDLYANFIYENDEDDGKIYFRINNTDTETGGGAKQNSGTPLTLRQSLLGSFVGIGVTTPSCALDIDGDIKFSGTLQDGTIPWANIINVPTQLGQWFLTANGGATKIQVDGGETLSLIASKGISLAAAPESNSLTISATYSAGSGIDLINNTIVTNTDKGSSQSIFKRISDGSKTIVASSNNDTLKIIGGANVSVDYNESTKTISISSPAGIDYIAGDNISISGESISVVNNPTFSGPVTVEKNEGLALVVKKLGGVNSLFSVDADGNIRAESLTVKSLISEQEQETEGDLTVKGSLFVVDPDNASNVFLSVNKSDGSVRGSFIGTVNGVNITALSTTVNTLSNTFSNHLSSGHSDLYYSKSHIDSNFLSKTASTSQTITGNINFSTGFTVNGTGTSSFAGNVSIAGSLEFSSLSASTTVPWAKLSNAPSSAIVNIDDAVSKRHSQNTDTGTTSTAFRINSSSGSATIASGLYISSAAFPPYMRWSGSEWQFYSAWGDTPQGWAVVKAGSFIKSDGTEVSYSNHTHANLHDPVTVSGNGLVLNGQQLSLSFGTTAATVSAGHTHPYLSNTHAASGVTTTLISNWNNAYTHSTSAHAPSDAPSNAMFTAHTGNASIHKDWGQWSTNGGQDLKVFNKRALVGYNTDSLDKLMINYSNDFANGVCIYGNTEFKENIIMASNKTIDGRDVSADGTILDSLNTFSSKRVRKAVKLTAAIPQDVNKTLTSLGISGVAWAPTNIVLINVNGRLNIEDVGATQFDYIKSGTETVKFHYDIPKDSVIEIIVL